MSQVQAEPPRGALRIVLFGMPDAGKSSLLGALAQAAQMQPQALKGRLVDPNGGLESLRLQLYEGRPIPTGAEVVSYPVTLEPLTDTASGSEARSVSAVVMDCDGQVANQILARQHDLTDGPAASPLTEAILGADTLVLVVDASASAEVVRRDFALFARFLRLLEQGRSQRSEVSGLPVYLVLTKCDLLVKKGDTRIAWIERIEEHKRTVDRKFQEYLTQQAGREAQPFGKIDLHLWATAVKHPALEQSQPRPREPYGVAELFRQCVHSAQRYRAVQAHAGRRLRWTLAALFGLLGLFVLLGLFFLATRPSTAAGELENKIRGFHSDFETSALLLREPLADKIKKLEDFQKDSHFSQVGREWRDYVKNSLAELKAYQRYSLTLRETAKAPRRVDNDADLQKLIGTLEHLLPPQEYRADWSKTEAVQRRDHWLHDAELLQREVAKAEAAFKGLLQRRRELDKLVGLKAIQEKAAELLKDAQRLPYKEGNRDPLPEAQDTQLTYRHVLDFERVRQVYEAWQEARRELQKLTMP
jgi:GTPase SAR1 family protein